MQNFMKTILSSVQTWTNERIKNSVSDWNENDFNKDSYIKNRPFYEETKATTIVNNLTYSQYDNDQYPKCNFIPGQEYEIIWNGKSYKTACYNDGDWNIIADESLGCPFYIDDDGGNGLHVSDDNDSDNWTVSIIYNVSKITKIPLKYLPEISSVGKEDEGENAEIFNDYENNVASGNYSHAEGCNTTASGESSHAEGCNTTASGESSHAEGCNTTASGESSHAEGYHTTASGRYSHAEGINSIAIGYSSHAESYATAYSLSITGEANATTYTTDRALGTVIGGYGYAVYNGVVSKVKSLPQYDRNLTLEKTLSYSDLNDAAITIYVGAAIGDHSHTEGYLSSAVGDYSHAEGHSDAVGDYSHAEGDSYASGAYSHAEGNSTIATSENQHTQGRYNIEDAEDQYAHIVGNGTSDTNRSNAHTLDWDGNAWFAGDVYVGSTSGKNKDEGSKKLATEEYVDALAGNCLTKTETYIPLVDSVTGLTYHLSIENGKLVSILADTQ